MSTVNVCAGDKIKAGQMIGIMGNLGKAKTMPEGYQIGDHLHFQHYDRNGNLTDPVYMYNWDYEKF